MNLPSATWTYSRCFSLAMMKSRWPRQFCLNKTAAYLQILPDVYRLKALVGLSIWRMPDYHTQQFGDGIADRTQADDRVIVQT